MRKVSAIIDACARAALLFVCLSVAAAGCDPHAALLVLPDETDLRVDVDLEPALPQADEDGRLDGAGLGPDAGDVAELLLRGQQDHPGR